MNKLKKSISNLTLFRIDSNPNRPTLVFLHDSLGCITLWRDFPERLAKKCRCNVLIYDRQGYGESPPFKAKNRANDYLEKEADVLMALIEEEELDEVILFGHSDGGSIALIAAAKYPKRIIGIITEGAHIFVEEITLRGIESAIRLFNQTDLKNKLSKYHGDKAESVFWAWVNIWTSETFRTWSIEHFLPDITCPGLIIQGEADEFGTLRQVDEILRQSSGPLHRLILPAIGHTPHKEATNEVLKHAEHFVLQLIKN